MTEIIDGMKDSVAEVKYTQNEAHDLQNQVARDLFRSYPFHQFVGLARSKAKSENHIFDEQSLFIFSNVYDNSLFEVSERRFSLFSRHYTSHTNVHTHTYTQRHVHINREIHYPRKQKK